MPDINVNIDDIDTDAIETVLSDACVPTLNKEVKRLVAECVLGFLRNSLSFERVEEAGVSWIVLYLETSGKFVPVYAEKLDEIYHERDAEN